MPGTPVSCRLPCDVAVLRTRYSVRSSLTTRRLCVARLRGPPSSADTAGFPGSDGRRHDQLTACPQRRRSRVAAPCRERPRTGGPGRGTDAHRALSRGTRSLRGAARSNGPCERRLRHRPPDVCRIALRRDCDGRGPSSLSGTPHDWGPRRPRRIARRVGRDARAGPGAKARRSQFRRRTASGRDHVQQVPRLRYGGGGRRRRALARPHPAARHLAERPPGACRPWT